MMNKMEAIEQTPPKLLSADKATIPVEAEDTVIAKAENLETTLSEIDRLISDVVVEKDVVAEPLIRGRELKRTLQKI
jgi:hypothetical protein